MNRLVSGVPVISKLLIFWYAEPTWLLTLTLRAWKNRCLDSCSLTLHVVFSMCLLPYLQRVHCGTSKSNGGQQCWG